MKKPISKILVALLAVCMLVSALPMIVFAAFTAGGYNDGNGGSDYYKVFSEKEWDIAPGIKEYEQVLNNSAGTRRQVVHTAVVDINNPYTKVIAGYKGMWPEEGNYGVQSTSVQALEAEKLGVGNVVIATNTTLSWYTSQYYKDNPHLIGEPLGYTILDGEMYYNSSWTYNEETKTFTKHAADSTQTVIVINYDGHPLTGETRPADMPKVWIRNTTDPLTGWEYQAIPVSFAMLVKPDSNGDGIPENCYASNPNHTLSDNASRTFVGVRPNGELVIAVSDGEQGPYSYGFTSYEMAEYMIKMGCVIAANCDGGGSTTFCSQRPGEDLKLNCSLSDGGERPTTSTILVISTAPADGEFARAQISSDYDYYTPGSTVRFSALGSDAVGTKVDIPSDVQWQIKEEGMGTIENGVFKSNGTEGKVTVQMVYDGKVVGEKKITVVTPDTIFFEQPTVTIPFGKTAKIPVKATAAIDGVAQEIGLGDNDVTFAITNEDLGTFNGLKFAAVDEDDAPADIAGTVTATLNMGTNPTATVQLKLGKGSVVLWDFEGGQADIDEWNVINNRKNAAHWDYYLNLSLADRTNGQVHDGNYSMRLETNGLSSKDSHAEQYAWIRLGVDGEAVVLKNARRVGFWLYVPEDNVQCMVQGHYMTDTNGDGVFDNEAVVNMMEQEDIYYNFDESGWHYLSMDISAFEEVALKASNQFDKDPSDGMTGEKGEFFIALIFHKVTNNLLWSENGSINGNYTYYIDNFTVDYSEAVDDRESPIFDKIYLDGTTALIKRDVVTTTSSILSFTAAVADKTTLADAMGIEQPLYNVSGLDADTAKVYIDGVEVKSTFANGVISATDIKLADGYHRVKFEICDKAGNKSSVIRVVKVESGSTASTLQLVPADATLDRIPFGSIYWMNLEANAIETIKSVSAVIDLNNVNHWELDHMETAYGFTAEYTINEETNTATITITRTGNNDETGTAVLAKLPVRIVYFDTDIKVPGYTAETYWTSFPFSPQDMKMDVDMGLITFINGTTSTFSNEEFQVDTEMFTDRPHMAQVNYDYLNNHGTTHVHNPVAIEDKAPTCTENGYTGRTFCEGCNSPVEWGTVVPATGHTFEVDVVNRRIVCHCGSVYAGNGLITIGAVNYYTVNGQLMRGWYMVEDDWYYFDKTSFAGWNGKRISDVGVVYTFDGGRVTAGTWVEDEIGKRYWYGPSYYQDTTSELTSCAPFEIDGKLYLFSNNHLPDKGGYMQTGIVGSLSTYGMMYYDCGTDGVATLLNGVAEDKFYVDGYHYKKWELIEWNGDYYFNEYYTIAKDKKIYLNAGFVEGHTYPNGDPMQPGYYDFDEDGKMILLNGVYDGYYYINGIKQTGWVLFEWDGNYYFNEYYNVARNKRVYLSQVFVEGKTYPNGDPMKVGYYDFDKDGKMILLNGVVDGIYYINGIKQTGWMLFQWEGNYYFNEYYNVARNKRVYLSQVFVEGKTYPNGDPMKVGYYDFDKDGKMILLNGVVDGIYYINGIKQTGWMLFQWEGNYYFNEYYNVARNKRVYLTEGFVTGKTYPNGDPMKVGYYDFDKDGKMILLNGVYDGYYYINGIKQTGWVLFEWDGNYYFNEYYNVARNKRVYLSQVFVEGKTYPNGDPMKVGYYDFDKDGKMILLNGVVDGIYYINGIKQTGWMLFQWEGNYYFNEYYNVARNKRVYLSQVFVEGKTYPNGDPMKVGYYDFDKDGKMIILNGVVDGIYYINGIKQTGWMLFEWNGNLYFNEYYNVAKSKKVYLTEVFVDGVKHPNGLILAPGYYEFDADGKMIVPQ